MPRAAKPRQLKFTVDIDTDGMPFVSAIEFCSAKMQSCWGTGITGLLDLNDSGEPEVMVYLVDRYTNITQITKSPFTGGDLVTSVVSDNYDAVVAALQAQRVEPDSPTLEEGPAAEEELPDGYEDEETGDEEEDNEADFEEGDEEFEEDDEDADEEEDEEFEEDEEE